MAKQQNWSEDDLRKKGYIKNESTGDWSLSNIVADKVNHGKLRLSKALQPLVDVGMKDVGRIVHLGRPVLEVIPDELYDSCDNQINNSTIILKGLSPGMNELLRKHFTFRKKVLENYIMRLRALQVRSFGNKVNVTFTRYSSVLMDWDNMCSSFKIPGDALKGAGIITDDSPLVIINFLPKQEKCRKKSGRIKILIENAE